MGSQFFMKQNLMHLIWSDLISNVNSIFTHCGLSTFTHSGHKQAVLLRWGLQGYRGGLHRLVS